MRTFRACYFNPRSPHGERPQSRANPQRCWKFQSTLPARGATLLTRQSAGASVISIHAPRTGSDATDGRCTTIARHFNPRSPHGERLGVIQALYGVGPFQSTLPARGATAAGLRRREICLNFNPRSPHGERRIPVSEQMVLEEISIHAPRTGSDGINPFPCGRSSISIHAPRTGSDNALMTAVYSAGHFNPRFPHGERRGDDDGRGACDRFQSTLPARGATSA